MRRPLLYVLLLAALIAVPGRAGHAAETGVAWLIPPVDGAMTRAFDPPESDFGAGHRGIDFGAAAGAAVRAAGPGTVTFAGPVAASFAVSIQHQGALATTYSFLAEVSVSAGDEVRAGTWVGRAGAEHGSAAGGMHFGVKLDGAYVDPALYLGPVDTERAIHLAPIWAEPLPIFAGIDFENPLYEPACETPSRMKRAPSPPNDNIAVAVAGIGSRTAGGVRSDLYLHGPEWLGYAPQNVYPFSYRSTGGPHLHEPYERADTYGDIELAAEKLRELLAGIAVDHPGKAVDLIAHSQGGIVARTYLARVAKAWAPGLPQVDHLITFSSPHDGAPLADAEDRLSDSLIGQGIVEGLKHLSESGAPFPHPDAPAIEQLAPGSDLLVDLGDQDLLYGTRALALAIPNDVVVPADRARLDEETSRIVPPEGLNGHEAILTSEAARGMAYAFLRDAPDPCTSRWDNLGGAVGGAVGWYESAVPSLIGNLLP